MVAVERIRFDGGAIGALATATPSLQWELRGDEKNWVQKKYDLEITYNDKTTSTHSDTTSNSTHIEWPGKPLGSRETVSVRARVFGEDGSGSEWSEAFSIKTGVLDNTWSAPFIQQENQMITSHHEKITPEILFRSPTFATSKPIESATVYSTALGVYELEVNGKSVGEAILAPGWTSYEHRLLHQVFDVTSLIAKQNVIGGRVASGWFSGYLGFDGGNSNIYGSEKALSLELVIRYTDGTSETITTGKDWKATDQGPITNAQLYNGETYDSTKEIAGWSSVECDESSWSSVSVVANPSKRVVTQSFGYTKVVEILKPIDIIRSRKGKQILDLGQNAVGFVHMKKVKGMRGRQVTFQHAEVMENGGLGVRPLREAKATDVYTFKGDAEGEEYTPRFTFHGCRYVQVENYPGKLALDSVEFLAITSEMEEVGTFECSDPQLNRLHRNVFHSTRGNFISIPADCPQRDERMGWLGDIALFAQTGLYMFDSYNFLKSWLEDVKYEQDANGGYPAVVIPDVIKAYDTFWNGIFAAIWQDACVIVPWRLYEATKNSDVLVAQYDSMKGWYEFLPKIPGKIRWDKIAFQLGDWLDPTAPPDDPAKAMTDAYMVGDAFLYLILTQLVQTAKVLGKDGDFKYFTECAEKCKSDFADEYITNAGRLVSESQTAYALTICFGLYGDEKQLKYGGERLSALCKGNGYKIGTGFAGTPFVTEALVQSGHLEDAYKMLLTKDCPSWLYPVSMGATTIWERWDSMMPDGSINPGDMTSFNHYALGAVATWMHERIGGLKMGDAGFESVVFEPMVGGGLSFAGTKHRSPHGWIESKWEKTGEKTKYNVKVPLNTSAEVVLPSGEKKVIGSGFYEFEF